MHALRNVLIGLCLGMVGGSSAARAANSCANIVPFSSYDQKPFREFDGIPGGVGSFRIADELDENKQPNFNLAFIDCERQFSDEGKITGLECKISKVVTWAENAAPDIDKPNCSIDFDTASFPMKELSKGILTGIEEGTNCFNSLLTIDRTAKRIYLSFTRSKYADKFEKIKSGACGSLPRTEVLMNCTAWAGGRKGNGPPRSCDFGGSGG